MAHTGAGRSEARSPPLLLSRRMAELGSKPPFAASRSDVCYAGQSRLMQLQHVSPLPFSQNGDGVAAVQHKFPKAVIQCGLIGRNPWVTDGADTCLCVAEGEGLASIAILRLRD
ncbi:hypothetical protein SAMN05444004_12322 [Jannaschia faecimaris]|uniref:Uncharacterized protein n=1 Tax=Jannaschia faecimaris TaxID=1244108 RepID=A0A1H3U461_9RHOB|nr:hypothetical protein SAMN05444004_12322 [Jannaschia faecimaris]